MSTASPDRRQGTRRPGRPVALAAAAGVALVAAVLAVGLATRGPDADPATSGPGAAQTPTTSPTPTPEPDAAPADPSPPADDPAAIPPPVAGPASGAPDDGGAPASGASVVPPPAPELPRLEPVPFDGGEADFGTEVVARVTEVVRVDGEARGPGESPGPALAVTVQMDNGTAEPVDLDFVVVDLTDAAGDVGQILFGDPRSAPFSGALPAGGSRTATYVLRLPDPTTSGVTVTLSYGAEAPTAVFSGPVPGGSSEG